MARASSFSRAMAEFAKAALLKEQTVFVRSAALVRSSIQYGSELTGAPPIPVAADKIYRHRRKSLPPGALRDSVTLTFPDANTAVVYTTLWYAPVVEDNAQGHTFASGAPHGWKTTHAAWDRIVDATAKREAGA